MIGLLKRAARWWWNELKKPWAVDPPEPMDWGDSSEPAEPWLKPEELKAGLDKIKRDKTPSQIDLTNLPIYGYRKHPPVRHEVEFNVTDRDAMTTEERELWEDIEGGKPKHDPIVYPPVREQSTQDWVTERLQTLTGGLTRHPYDLTQYPTPPTEADLAAREYANKHFSGPRALFSHGYSMQYLTTLLRRADARDMTLTAEELMGLRSRGLA